MIPLQQQQYKFYQLIGRIFELSSIFLIVILNFITQKIKKEKGKQQQQVAQVDSSDYTRYSPTH